MGTSWFPRDYLVGTSWFIRDYLVITSWLCRDYLGITSWFLPDYIVIFSWLPRGCRDCLDYLVVVVITSWLSWLLRGFRDYFVDVVITSWFPRNPLLHKTRAVCRIPAFWGEWDELPVHANVRRGTLYQAIRLVLLLYGFLWLAIADCTGGSGRVAGYKL